MSTSDAAEQKLRAAGQETATPPCGSPRSTRSPAAKKQQDEAFRRFRPQSYHGGPAEQALSALTSGLDRRRKDELHLRALSNVNIHSSAGSSFTSCVFFKLSKPEGSDPSEQRPSLIKPLLVRTKSSSTFLVNGRPSSSVSLETTSISSSPETIPFPSRREENLFPAVNHEVEATSRTRVLSNGDYRPHEQNGLHLSPRGSQQRSFSQPVTGIKREKLLKDSTNQAHPGSDPPGAMLSSTVVTVLAPHWSGRLRRNKRFDGSGNSETQDAVKHDHGFQHGVESSPRRVPVLGTRRNTVGWSAKSDPSSLDFESRRKLTQTVSLDPSAPHVGSFLRDPNDQRRNPQTGHQAGFSPLSSNPPTSSLLLSFRRFNNRNCNPASDSAEESPSPLTSDRIGKPFNNNNHERPKPLLSPSYKASEPGMVVSPTSSNHRDSLFFSPENSSYTRQPPTSLTSSKDTDKNTNLSSDIPSSRHSQYDTSPAGKPHPLPRRTTLTSTSWWKKVSQEGNDGIKDESKTMMAPPFNPNNDTASLGLPDNKRLAAQIPRSSDNNNAAEPLCRGNVSLALRAEAERFGREKYGANFNREAQKPRSFLDGLSGCRSAPRPTKPNVSNASFTAKIGEPPTDSSKYKSTDCPPNTSSSHSFTPSMKFSSLSVDSTSVLSRQAASHHDTSGFSRSPNSHNSFSFHSRPQTPQTSRFTSKSNITPIGFERNYACVPKPFQPKSPGVDSFSRTNSSPSSVPSSLSVASLSATPPRTSPTSLLTPPATPVISALSLDASSPKGGRLSSSSPGSEAKNAAGGSEGKKARRVTWEDSVDVQRSEPDRLSHSVPSIFSFLRSGSPGRTANMQAGKGGKFRSLSSDSAEKAKPRPDGLTFDRGGRDGNSFRTLSVESATAPCRPTAALSLPQDFSNGYKLRYSSPPYSTLVSSRQTPERFPAFSQPSQTDFTPQLSPNMPVRPPLPLPSPFIPPAGTQSSNFSPSDADRVNNNYSKHLDSQIQLLDNRVDISAQSLPGDSFHSSSSTYVTETLVYSIKPKADAEPKKAPPKSLQHGDNTAVCVENEFNGPQCNGGMKEGAPRKSSFYSVEANNEQSSKRSRFALKKSLSTPSSAIGSDSDRVSKSYNRMDQVFHKLRQKFGGRRSEEDAAFPWKWKRSGQVPSVSGSSDISSVSNNSGDSIKTLEEPGVETDAHSARMQSRYASPAGDTKTVYQLSVWSEKSGQESEQNELNALEDSAADGDQFDPDYKAANQLLSDPSQSRKSTPSPRSPFSPFSSLSPLSPFTPPDATDDSVFFSPKLQRRRESSSPCEPREGISLGGSRRSRASTGPPRAAPGTDWKQLDSSYANLKYGIEPGRSFSVSSVLSSRPSGPGRISTGSRFMSVGDLSQSALSCRDSGRDVDQSPVTPDWTGEFGFQPQNNSRMPRFSTDPSKMRSRSLPRSLTRCLTNWSSGVSPLQPSTSSKPGRLRSPMNTCHFAWDADGPPTPPPTPPLSPVSRRMAKPPSLSSPTFPSSPGALQQADSRGRLHSRDYVSSLGTFDESSDSSSDTTTDDEYYLETDGEGEKETEL